MTGQGSAEGKREGEIQAVGRLPGRLPNKDILARAEALAPRLIDVRRDLHRHPEIGFEEIRTSAFICRYLDHLGITYQAGLARTGIVADLGKGRPMVALRADMDALPITERTNLPFASEVPGVMHACGHDAHTAALLGAASLLSELERPPGTIRLIFQPAEEVGDEEGKSGACKMVEAGVLEGVDAVIGMHNIVDQPPGVVLVSPGPVLAATDAFEVVIHGLASHGAYPHRGVDAIVLAAQVVNAIQSIVARRIDPMEAGVITVGTIFGGRKANIIADRVDLTGTVRSFSADVRQRILSGLENACHLAKLQGGNYEIRISRGHPATVNHPVLSALVADTALGLGFSVGEEKPSPVSEDFSLFSSVVPGVYFLLGAALDDGLPTRHAHNALFDLDERFIPQAAALFAEVALQFLSRHPRGLSDG